MAMAEVREDPMATVQDVQERLASIKAPGTFATRRTSPADNLRLEVKGIGRIAWPITRATARRLCAMARPACYGLKDETRFDRRVRDCWEISKRRISIEGRTWGNTLRPSGVSPCATCSSPAGRALGAYRRCAGGAVGVACHRRGHGSCSSGLPVPQPRAGLLLPTAKILTRATPAMNPPMCAMKATPPPDCGPCPITPNALINWNTNQSPTAT
jgi:hypothetical protein